MDTLFIDGFTKAATAAGVPAAQIPALLEQSLLLELLTKDAAFREGFIAELEKAGQYAPDPNGKPDGFWRGLGNLFTDNLSMIPGVGMYRQHKYRKQLQAANNPNNVANKFNQQKQEWMRQRQQKDQMYGMQGRGGRPGYGVPTRWSGGYGEPGWY